MSPEVYGSHSLRSWPALLRDLPARICAVLLPPRCLLCGEPGDDGRDLCAACHRALPRNHCACPRCAIPLAVPGTCGHCLRKAPPLQATWASFVYAPPVDRLLARYKFHHDLAAGRLLAGLMLPALADAERPQALVPVPLHSSRLRRRGYDQALELARPLARATGLPLAEGVLLRQRRTEAQSELGALARRRNLRGAFVVRGGRPLPAHVALVDDVMTTGATLHAAALALRRAGVARVDAWICARTP
ncbi:phosphoribosyltransferase [Pseudoxanthomonas suwonensis 11-1]|uniref:Phosphoribosyltransferase n=1 Tax=Pseudoxanthomonas suwonensis (strain 11-1) TaxID=743721 RepID=E6WXA9_PSEUU|nr:phosphoribosyltransferase [Pseudoxanthomonas suwonensis 11-1]